MPKVSVVIAVYKAEPYIERCVRTLFGQTLDDLEFIFVDDCSPDRSIEVMERVLEEFPARKQQVKIIRHEVNQGVSSARQHGVDAATGEYIIHCDPDDWVELNMYEAMYAEAKASHADIVICDFFNHRNGKETIVSQEPERLDSMSVLEGIAGRSFHKLHGSLWNKLIKSACYTNNAFYTDISYCEDAAILFCIFSIQHSISYLPLSFYHYRTDTPSSLVKQFDSSSIKKDFQLIEKLIQLSGLNNSIRFIGCIKSYIIKIIFSRTYLHSNLSDDQFKDISQPYYNHIDSNIDLGSIKKGLLKLAVKGHYKLSLRILRYLSKMRSLTKSIHQALPIN